MARRPKSGVTLTELAAQLGLSVCTVSNALRDVPGSRIPAATRQRVLRKAEAVGYRANLAAQALVSGRTHVIGALTIGSEPSFFAGFVTGLEQVAAERGYHVMLCRTHADTRLESSELDLLRQRGVDGAVVEHAGDVSVLKQMAESGYPMVLLAACPEVPDLDYVTFDDVAGGRIATEALIASGCRRIQHLGGPLGGSRCGDDRLEGYLKAMKQAGLSAAGRYLNLSEADVQSESAILQTAVSVLKRKDRPDGVVCFDDTIAWCVLQAAQQLGLRVPEDVSIIGYGDEDFCRKVSVPLSSIHIDMQRLGKEAGRVLLDKVEGKAGEEPVAMEILPTVVHRSSTRSHAAPPMQRSVSRSGI